MMYDVFHFVTRVDTIMIFREVGVDGRVHGTREGVGSGEAGEVGRSGEAGTEAKALRRGPGAEGTLIPLSGLFFLPLRWRKYTVRFT